MNRQLVIGAGCGRTGTVSLATLLNMQHGARVTHERFTHRFKWKKPDQWCRRILRDYSTWKGAGLYGDVALQHGSWLDQWCREGAKVVIMKRELEPWLKSFHKKSGTGRRRDRNNWQPPGEGGTPGISRWYGCFPVFSGLAGKQEGLLEYYNHYYNEITPAVLDRYPRQVILCYVDVFNTVQGQRQLLDFLGVPREEQVIKVGLKKNRLAS